jgi:hypothetical protein
MRFPSNYGHTFYADRLAVDNFVRLAVGEHADRVVVAEPLISQPS